MSDVVVPGQVAPPESFQKQARIKSMDEYRAMYQRSIEYPEGFWGEMTKDLLTWFREPTVILDSSNHPFYQWFVDGTLNISYNCLDRHVEAGRGDKVAILFEGEPGDVKEYTYADLLREVSKLANVLKGLGVVKGDRVCLYMPMIAELPIAMLACARIGAMHSIVFGGFSAEALNQRIDDAKAKVVITCDGGWRRGKVVPLKAAVDDAIRELDCVEKVIVYKRCDNPVTMTERDVWWDDIMADASAECPCEVLEAEHPLFILYTSGTTGKPKGVQHCTGGYLTQVAATVKYVFDIRDDDVYWCTADIGWVTGHSYVCYGPLAMGALSFIYEGAPDTPNWERFWEMIERHKITILYTAPTAIRAFMKQGEGPVQAHDISSLRLLGTVGEPINPAAWDWYFEIIGGSKCPIVDTWWQTETGAHMITGLPGATPMVPGSATKPFFGVDAVVVDDDGNEVGAGESGLLVIRKPWPSMLRTVYGDPERYKETYWRRWGGRFYFAGDGARYDENKNIWITGRVDDVLNVSGHRLDTAEVESALVSHAAVAEAAVVGFPHDLKGEGIAAFVSLRTEFEASDDLKKSLQKHVRTAIGPIASPDQIHFTASLPKTRSGKIMRRLLRDVAAGKETTGDTSTLEDLTVLAKLRTDED